MHVLLIEDNEETAAHVAAGLTRLGHKVGLAFDGREGLRRAAEAAWDCLIVDRMLPGFDGLTLVRTLRSAGARTPVIFLTAVGGVADRVEGLRAGADDYLIKPFELEELAARVEALARRPPLAATGTRLQAGDLELDRLARTVRLGDRLLDLTTSEFGILELLMMNAGHSVTRAMMLQAVFGLAHVNPAAIVEPHVSRLRAKLEREGAAELVQTVRGAGYLIHAG